MTLTQLFTAIANAIRTKTGSSDTIVAEDFPEEIADIQLGKLTNAQYTEATNDLDDIFEGVELPSTYQQVEYLESSGTQYIDTGRVPNNTDIIEQKFQSKNTTNTTYCWYGSMPSSGTTTPRISMGITNGSLFFGVNYTANYSYNSTELTHIKWKVIEEKKFEVILNGERSIKTVAGNASVYSPTISLTSYLFARHGNDGVQVTDGAGTKIYFHREYLADGTIQLNLIPCYRKSDGVAGMYDTISETFLTNLGTGTFVVGNDVDILNTKVKNILTEKTDKIIPENIKNGISLLGITGSYTGLDTSDADATAGDILKDKTAYVNGQKLTGTHEASGGPILKKDVNFYDYDGTLVYSYTKTEFLALTEMPANPSHTGLVAQGWNWSLSDAKTYVTDYGVLEIGQTYTTSSGNTEFDIEVTTKTGLTVTCNMIGTKDWGDGTSDSGYSHTYSSVGKYTITCDGTSYNGSYIFGSSSSNIPYYVVGARITKATSIPNYAFNNCYSLKYITISSDVTSVGSYVFNKCYSLKSIVIPSSITTMSNGVFSDCRSLQRACLSKDCGGSSASSYMFNNCYSLESLIIPTSVTTIYGYMLQNCYSLTKLVIPTSVTTISNSAFIDSSEIIEYDFSNYSAVPTLSNAGAFTNINYICKIIVPNDLYSSWITASIWSSMADYIVSAN